MTHPTMPEVITDEMKAAGRHAIAMVADAGSFEIMAVEAYKAMAALSRLQVAGDYVIVLRADLQTLVSDVFGDKAGDEPNIYADYDRLCELSRKWHAMLAAAPNASQASEWNRAIEAAREVSAQQRARWEKEANEVSSVERSVRYADMAFACGEVAKQIANLRALAAASSTEMGDQWRLIGELRQALEFYADPWGKCDQVPDFYSELDFGSRAFDALKPLRNAATPVQPDAVAEMSREDRRRAWSGSDETDDFQ